MTVENARKSNLSSLKSSIGYKIQELTGEKYYSGSSNFANLIFRINYYTDGNEFKIRGLFFPLDSDNEVLTLLKEKISNFQGRVRVYHTQTKSYIRVLNEETLYAAILQHILQLPKTGFKPFTMDLYLDGAELARK